MAFTETQKLTICKIVGLDADALDFQLLMYSESVTSGVETQVIAELTRWDLVDEKFTKIRPNATNYGADVDPERNKSDIRKNIRTLLFLPQAAGNRLVRS
jgi:hypothetical protein